MLTASWRLLRQKSERHPIRTRLVIAAAFGLLLDVLFRIVPMPPLAEAQASADDAADQLMRIATLVGTVTEPSPRFAFIDIDDKTWFDWGAPLVTPRDRLAVLIDRVSRSKPAAIVVDVDLSFREAGDGTEFSGSLDGRSKSEEALARQFETYPVDSPPLLLVRSLVPDEAGALPKPRPTIFDSVTDKPNIVWAQPSFERDGDGIVRRWLLTLPVCLGDAPQVMPSVQLAAAWTWWVHPFVRESLASSLASSRPASCSAAEEPKQVVLKPTPAAPLVFLDGSDTSARIIYAIPWASDATGLGPRSDTGNYKVAVRSARSIERIPANSAVPGIGGSIAVIGGSYAQSGDWYYTPLGPMPGTVVLINAIDALIQHGTPKPPPLPISVMVSVGMILLTALAVATLRPAVAALAVSAGVAALTVLTLPLLKSGYLISLAAPSFGIVAMDLLHSVYEEIKSLRRKGWRWFFKTNTMEEGEKP